MGERDVAITAVETCVVGIAVASCDCEPEMVGVERVAVEETALAIACPLAVELCDGLTGKVQHLDNAAFLVCAYNGLVNVVSQLRWVGAVDVPYYLYIANAADEPDYVAAKGYVLKLFQAFVYPCP